LPYATERKRFGQGVRRCISAAISEETAMTEGTVVFVHFLPFPWPPPKRTILLYSSFDGSVVELWATERGTLQLTVAQVSTGTVLSFTSQPIAVMAQRPRPVMGFATWNSDRCSLRLSGQDLVPAGENAPVITLPASPVRAEKSFEAADAVNACRPWIANRKSKFSTSRARQGRRPKTIQEQAADLREPALRLRYLSQEVRAGKQFLLGALAADIRASVYWPAGRDSEADRKWNPILLRMASKADLPLPVYAIPSSPQPPAAGQAQVHLTAEIPRVDAVFTSDEICDLQEVLKRAVLRLGPEPGRKIIALELLAELAHTMGAAHYDDDASQFADFMRTMGSARGDLVTTFACWTAETLASLSEWVLSELRARKLIT
jgi:hypothetical protein